MDPGHARGRAGEDLAACFLESCGFTILARRWRRPGGEVDLVATRPQLVVFVEVKTRGPRAWTRPEDRVRPVQRLILRRLARQWLAANPRYLAWECRCDVVAVDLAGEGRGLVLRHYPGAF